MALNFNTTPYYDDFDEDKNFHRILFRPGRAVQARELTQSQTQLQDQVKKFGDHIFKDGSRVTGASIFSIGEGNIKVVSQNRANLAANSSTSVSHIKLQSTFEGTTINVSNFIGKYITTNTAISAEANVKNIYFVHHADAAVDSDPDTLYVSYIRTEGNRLDTAAVASKDVANDANLQIFSTSDVSSSNLLGSVTAASADAFGKAKLLGVTEGVFYTNGIFVKNSQQIIAVDKYNANANVSIGFELNESIVSATSDTSLLDPALDSSNYLAPGGDRYKISLNLSKKQLDSANLSLPSLTTNKYIELVRYKNGLLVKDTSDTRYSDLGRTLARRTYDESGDYVVDGLKTRLETEGNTSMFLHISPGKAYVKGYEVNKLLSTQLDINRARDTETITGHDVSTFYGNHINVTDANTAAFNSNVSERVELYSSNTVTDGTTKIAEAYVRNQQYVSGSGSSTINRLYLFDVKTVANTGGVSLPLSLTKTIVGQTDSGSCNVDATSTVTFERVGEIVNNTPHLTLTAGDAAGVKVGDEVFGHNVSSFSAADASPGLHGTTEAERRIYVTDVQGSNLRLSAVSLKGEEQGTSTYQFRRAVLSDPTYEASVFESSYGSVASLNQANYDTKRIFKSVTFTNGQATITTNDGTERFKEAATALLKQTFYSVIVRTGTLSGTDRGAPVDLSAAGVTFTTTSTPGSADNLTIDLNDGSFSGTCDILTTIDITGAGRRTKLAVSGVKFFDEIGNTSTSIVRSLGVTDLINVTAIYISNDTSSAAGSSNVNVKDSFILDTGQKDSFYDHATIKLREGNKGSQATNENAVNTGNVRIEYNRFTHTGIGHFDANSYPVYESIPQHTRKDGVILELTNSIDFRPTRTDDETSNVYSNTSMTFNRNQIVDSREAEVDTELTYYLGRVDKVVLQPSGDFRVIEGASALNNPPTPADDNEAMTIMKMSLDPYTYGTSNVKIDLVRNRRYTMRDIGGIENRLNRMEYYTSLSLLEQEISGTTYFDGNNIQLFNSGFIVDDFRGHGIGDVKNKDYKCSISFVPDKTLHPRFQANATNSAIQTSGLTNTGGHLTLPYTLQTFTAQDIASGTTNINPFNVASFVGHVVLDTDVTTYADFNTRPLVNINSDGNSDMAEFGENFVGSKWGEWIEVAYNPDVTTNFTYYDTSGKLTSTTSSEEAGYGGTRTASDEIYYFMAQEDIEFQIFGYRPNTPVFLFLDGKNISDSLRAFDSNAGTFNRDRSNLGLISDANGYVKGLIKLEDAQFRFAAGEHTMLFCDNIFSGRFFSTSAVVKYYSGTPESRKPKEVVTIVQEVHVAAPVVQNAYFTDSDKPRNTVHQELIAADTASGIPISSTISSYASAIDTAYDVVLLRNPDIGGYIFYLQTINNFQNGVGETHQQTNPDILQELFQNSDEYKENVHGTFEDPLAQTFVVPESTHPDGVFLAAIDIFFSTKPSDGMPVTLEIRNVVNGYPSTEVILDSQTTLNPSDVVIPADSNIPEATRFTFRRLIYLEPGNYAIVLLSNSQEYNVYIGEVGRDRLDTNQSIVTQPYLGSLFKSQNAVTWSPEQGQDLCFALIQPIFDTAVNGFSAVIEPKTATDNAELGTNTGTEFYIDNFKFDAPFETYLKAPDHTISFQLGLTANGTSTMDPYQAISPNNLLYLESRKHFEAQTDLNVKISMASTNPELSPVFELNRSRFIFIENKINSSSNTEVVNSPETLASGGGASSKYITKKVSLEVGFEATGLRVFLAKNTPSGASVKVFYRVQSVIDNSTFEELPFVEMTQVTPSTVSQSVSEYYDCEYKAENISYTAEESTFSEFSYFQIKVVLFATNTARSPQIKNFRAIALS